MILCSGSKQLVIVKRNILTLDVAESVSPFRECQLPKLLPSDLVQLDFHQDWGLVFAARVSSIRSQLDFDVRCPAIK